MKEKKQLPILLGVLLIAIVITVGTTYTLWQITLQQTNKNVITTGCFKIEFSDINPINLDKSFPISDEEGESLVPYEFTITNTCDSFASYQINLEILSTTTLTDLSYIKEALNETTGEVKPKLLTTNRITEKSLENATSSYQLETGYLNAKESKTYNLRIWLGEETPLDPAYMNKTLNTKITVVTSYLKEIDTEIPVANFTTSKNETGVVVDASSSTDNIGVVKYNYSKDGVNYISSEESNHTFTEESIEYGIAPHTISKLYESKVNEVYVYVEDALGNKSEVKKQIIGDLVYDETADNNLRYIGKNPNNYVSFNEELWRIIGVMNNIEDGAGKKETRIKLIRNESIGSYLFDNKSQTEDTALGSAGSSDWSTSNLKKVLNEEAYFNRTSGSCPSEKSEVFTPCDFSSIGLLEESKLLISDAKWNLGGIRDYLGVNQGMTNRFYELERGTLRYSESKSLEWIGKIGLMYPSDYGYATSGSQNMTRETCLATKLYYWGSNYDCYANNWLYNSNDAVRTITPYTYYSFQTFIIDNGSVKNTDVDGKTKIENFPTLYLNSNVKIINGEGTESSPFVLEI